MYSKIFKIILKHKINLKIDFIIRMLSKFKIHIKNKYNLFFIWIFLKYLGCIFVAFGIGILISQLGLDNKLILALIFISMGLNQGYQGMIDYKDTFIFVFQDLKEIALATDKKIYKTLISLNLIYKLVINAELFTVSLIILNIYGINYNSWIYILNLLAISTCLYICGNLIVGKYVYSKTIKRIGVLRLLAYLILSILIWSTVFNLIGHFIYYFKIVVENFKDVNSLFNDAIWMNVFRNIETGFFRRIYEIKNILVLTTGLINIKSIIGTCIFIFIMLKYSNVNLIPMDKEIVDKKNDILHKLYVLIISLNRFLNRENKIFEYQVNKFLNYRWVFANNFFELVIINYEALCYMSICTALIMNTSNNIIIIQLIICMNIMVLANQSFELRVNGYTYFSFVKEKRKLELIKISLIDKKEIFNTKLNSFRLIYIIHILIVTIYSIFIGYILNVPILYLIIIPILNIILFFIMSLLQMHMIPIVTNFSYINESQVGSSFEEEELANKLQDMPRVFLVVIPMILTSLILLIPSIRLNIIIYMELLYIIVISFVLKKYMDYIVRKGMNNLYDKISEI